MDFWVSFVWRLALWPLRFFRRESDVLQVFLAGNALLVRFAAADGDADAVCVPDASEGIQGGESRHGPAHASLPAE